MMGPGGGQTVARLARPRIVSSSYRIFDAAAAAQKKKDTDLELDLPGSTAAAAIAATAPLALL